MAYAQLTSEQRYYISKHYRNRPLSQIAQTISCHPSAASFNATTVNGTYCYKRAQHNSGTWTKGKVSDRIGIGERPVIVDKKERIGDFEMDTVVGKNQKNELLVAVERKTKYVVIRKIKNFKAEDVAKTAVRALKPFKNAIKTITLDNGKEFYRHQTLLQFHCFQAA